MNLLTKLKDFKFVMTLVIGLKITESDDAAKYTTFCSNSKAEMIINESDIDDRFESIYNTIISILEKVCAGLLIQ